MRFPIVVFGLMRPITSCLAEQSLPNHFRLRPVAFKQIAIRLNALISDEIREGLF